MGTSSSSRGPGSGTPLVPPWADADGKGPGPTPPDARFTGFRTGLGKYVASGDAADLRKALGNYAGTATGGGATGARRFGAMASAGASLFGALSSGAVSAAGAPTATLELSQLNNLPTAVAIDRLLEVLVPVNGDGEKIREAMLEALSECLEGMEDFDFSHITEDVIVSVMIAYMRECVFTQIVMDSDRAFQRSGEAARVEDAEAALHELVKSAVDRHSRPLFVGGAGAMTKAAVEAAQLNAIRAVWDEWENGT